MKVGDAERSPFVGYVSLWGLSNDLNVIGRREAEPAPISGACFADEWLALTRLY